MHTQELIALIKSEMKPSYGCTEPAAIGLAVSRTCRYLAGRPEHIRLKIGSNIYKNAYSVRIPNTGKSGIALGAALGMLLSDRENTMEIFGRATAELAERAERLAAGGLVEVETFPDSGFYIEVEARGGGDCAQTITFGGHDRLAQVTVNGERVLDEYRPGTGGGAGVHPIVRMKIADLVRFCETVDLSELAFLKEGVEMNLAASRMGLESDYGLCVARTIRGLVESGVLHNDLENQVMQVVCAASDCRMGGGNVAVMTVLGSGNQGIQAILPSVAACQYLGLPEEKLLRAVAMSILITIFIKYQVGRLSPVCGATLSGSASAGAICWLMGGTPEQVGGAVQNTLGSLSGMVCDGAKDGCALKLRTCTNEAVMAARLCLAGKVIQRTDGIIGDTVEDTVRNVACLSIKGMSEIDGTVLGIMQDKEPGC